eukprot:6855477-Ditylum_brightwellii.AAC.1
MGQLRAITKCTRCPNAMQVGSTQRIYETHWSLMEMEDGLTWSNHQMHRSPNAMQVGLTWRIYEMHWSLMEMEDGSTQSNNQMHQSPKEME